MRAYAMVGLALLAACKSGDDGASSSAPAAASAQPPAAPPSNSGPPVSASFVEVSAAAGPSPVVVAPCSEAVLVPIRGMVNAADLHVGQGDIAAIRGQTTVSLEGNATVLVARARLASCDAPPLRTVVKADAARDVPFMHGTMHARFDLDDRELAPSFYFGRLSGTAAVAEHAHAGTWELLCAVEAAGTFTLAGAPSRLGGRTCVTVPPDTKHSWQPDTGSTLTALQMYWPPGPEQRFKKLAADDVAGDH